MDKLIENIKQGFNNHVSIQQKRPGIFQLYLPIYHEDGDMIDLFVSPMEENKYKLCDYGLTLQRLAYSYDIDTENKEHILQTIISENHLIDENGNLCLETSPDTVFYDIMHITQTFAKIGSMRFFKREIIENLFYEIIDEFIFKELSEFKPQKKIFPIPERDDLEADYQFSPNGHPIYLFGVKDTAKARLATISCLEYQKHKLNFRSLVVHSDFERLPRKDRTRLTNSCDKQFTSIDDFKSSAKEYLERERK